MSYIVFLHQTTTPHLSHAIQQALSYIVFLHQTTTLRHTDIVQMLLSYIVFLHQTTTPGRGDLPHKKLSYIVFLHQTTTGKRRLCVSCHCLISSFYIKPQLCHVLNDLVIIVLYRLSTSNHNYAIGLSFGFSIVLYRLSTSNHN